MIADRSAPPTWAAIFDLDDTLYPRWEYIDSAFRAVAEFLARSRGVPAAAVLATLREAHQRRAGMELQDMCERFALPATLVWPMRQVMRAHRPQLHLSPESRDVLVRLRTDGWRLGVLTNGLPAVQRRKVQALGIGRLVDHIVYAEEHSHRGKPAPRPFRAALERLRVASCRCVCVGDDPVADLQGARAVGLQTIWLKRRESGPAAASASLAVTGLREVPEALMRLRSAGVSHAA